MYEAMTTSITTITHTEGAAMEELQPQLLNRLDSVQGHLAGVRRMVTSGASPPELIQQVRALRGALYRVEELLVREGLRTCLQQAPQKPRQQTLESLMSLLHVKA